MRFLRERNNKLINDLGDLIYSDIQPIPTWRMRRGTERPDSEGALDCASAMKEAFDPAASGWSDFDPRTEVWGGDHEYFLFAAKVVIPERMAGRTVCFRIRTGREGLWDALNPQFLAYVDGVKRQGLDVNHREILLTESAEPDRVYTILLSAYTGDKLFHLLMDADIAVLERDVEALYYDLFVPYDTAKRLDSESEEVFTTMRAVTEALNLVDGRVPYSDEFHASIEKARGRMDRFYREDCGHAKQTVYAVGHTHIDLAWKWTLRVTMDKTVRSFATVLENMRNYPEFIFMSSTPQEYKYVKTLAPELYAEIVKRVKEGHWEPEGAMYVEPDCNLTSGESLVRQIIHGKRFFREEFGVDSKILWLPDVFGYSAALPQICRKAGVDYFMTTKISWSETNKVPYDTFLWEGIDGTRILTHFSSTRDYNTKGEVGTEHNDWFTTYNGMLNPSEVLGTWQRYQQKELNKEVLTCFGYGDGGGGPTREMLEMARREQYGIPGSPAVKIATASEFFRTLEARAKENPSELPSWVGELYLEYHRGTYTSQARNKRLNRRAEYALMDAETAGVLAEQWGYVCPKEDLYNDWDIVLRNQFHDILPGSAIREVYEDSVREYEGVLDDAAEKMTEALAAIGSAADGETDSTELLAYNFTGFGMTALAEQAFTPEEVKQIRELGITAQTAADGKLLIPVRDVPAKGFAGVGASSGSLSDKDTATPAAVAMTRENGTIRIETGDLRVVLEPTGHISSVYDKRAERELLKKGEEANVLMTYEDRPHNYNNWDINNYYTEKSWPVSDVRGIGIEEQGPFRWAVRVDYVYLSSTITQHILFYPRGTRFDIRTEVDWKEQQVLLKNWFPVDIHTSEASYEIQFGNVKRATHYNTSWDAARFEVCAHKWIDVSEDGYGLSILNDCKYGCSVHDGRIGLTLLKSGIDPDPMADKEHHEFTYAFLLHQGGWREAGTEQQAVILNNPPILAFAKSFALCGKAAGNEDPVSAGPVTFSLVSADAENIEIETVKKAMDTDGIIVRAYEYMNRRTKTTLNFGLPVKELYETDLLENIGGQLTVTEENRKAKAEVTFRPYEIRTFLIRV